MFWVCCVVMIVCFLSFHFSHFVDHFLNIFLSDLDLFFRQSHFRFCDFFVIGKFHFRNKRGFDREGYWISRSNFSEYYTWSSNNIEFFLDNNFRELFSKPNFRSFFKDSCFTNFLNKYRFRNVSLSEAVKRSFFLKICQSFCS